MAKDKHKKALSAEDVLADRVRPRPTAEELVTLILRVNPTGLGLSGPEEKQRYRSKAALQSLLLRRHPELVRVTIDDDIVDITLVGTGRHAAHVPLLELDEDMRAWVRRQLDTAAEDPNETPLAPTPAVTNHVVRSAVQHRAKGAFEAAQRTLEAGLQRTKERVERIAITAELIDLFVADLWDDVGALTLASTLHEEPWLFIPPGTQGALALAAARTGDGERARALLTRALGVHAVAAWNELGVQALAAGDVAAMESVAKELETLDPLSAVRADLQQALHAQKQGAMALADATLREELAAASSNAARRALIERHLRRWPKSTAANETLAHIEREERTQRIESLRARAATETSAQAQLALLRLAREEGAEGLDAQIAALDVEVERELLVAQRSALAAALTGEPVHALEAWLAAPKLVRETLTPNAEVQHAAKLIGAAGDRVRRSRELSRAALACVAVERALGVENVSEAARLVAAGGLVARELAEVLGIQGRIDSTLAETQKRAAQETLQSALAAFSCGDLETAEALLQTAPKGAARDALTTRLAAQRRRRELVQSIASLRTQGMLSRARPLVQRLAMLPADPPQPALRELTVAELDAEIWQHTLVAWGGPSALVLESTPLEERLTSVSEDGTRMAEVRMVGAYTFVRIIALEDARVLRWALLRHAPRERDGDGVRTVVYERTRIRWTTIDNAVCTLSEQLDGSFIETPHTEGALWGACLVPDSELAWFESPGSRAEFSVVRLDTGAQLRRVSEMRGPFALPFSEGFRVVTGRGDEFVSFSPEGRELGRFPCQGEPLVATVSKAGFFHYFCDLEDAHLEELSLNFCYWDGSLQRYRRNGILGANPLQRVELVALSETSFILAFHTSYGAHLAAIEVTHASSPTAEKLGACIARYTALAPHPKEAEEEVKQLRASVLMALGITVRWEVRLPMSFGLATTASGEHPTLITTGQHTVISRLSLETPPEVSEVPDVQWRTLGGLDLKRPGDAGVSNELLRVPRGEVDAWLLGAIERTRDHAHYHVRWLSDLVEVDPRAPQILEAALQLPCTADERDWLEAMQPVFAVRHGDRERALNLWRARQQVSFDPIIDDILRAYAGEDVDGDVACVLRAMDRSDQARAQGDFRAAIAALSIGVIWRRSDLHPLTRLADLWLRVAPENNAERYAQLRAFAEVCVCKHTLVVPRGEIWETERRRAVQRRAREALQAAHPHT